MNKEQHLQEVAGFYKSCIGIIIERSKKYASDEDPFLNFRRSADFAATTVVEGIMTRLGDKLSRLRNTLERAEAGDEYDDESLEDTFKDLCNYFVILRNWRIVEREERAAADQQLDLFEAEEPEEIPDATGGVVSALKKLVGIKVE